MENYKSSILIIDDDEAIIDTLSQGLSDLDCDVKGESDPQKAIEDITKNAYDIVITDIKMPHVTGIEIMQSLNKSGRDTQVIVMTGYAAIDTAIQSIQLGAYDYLQKPYELKHMRLTVKRALEKLHLQRANITLSKKIENMLASITLLYNISTILYEISSLNEALQMIMDTFTEVFKIQETGILLRDESLDNFRIVKHGKLSSKFVDQFSFKLSDLINNQKISITDPTLIEDINLKIIISDNCIPVDEIHEQCFLIPINFREELSGFLLVFFQKNNIYSVDEIKKLLTIFSTQIAPAIHSFSASQGTKGSFQAPSCKEIETNIIENKLETGPISSAILRIVFRETPKEISELEKIILLIKETIENKLNDKSQLIWQTYDTALLIIPGADLFSIEQFCFEMRKQIEKIKYDPENQIFPSLKFSCASYPQAGKSASDLGRVLWKGLFTELNKPLESISN